MTNQNDTTDDDNLSGAYVLNSLSETERRAFEQRMGASDDLRSEVTELADTAVLLGMATEPVQPSAGLRASVLAAAAQLPQLPREPESPVADAPPAVPAATAVPDAAPVSEGTATGGRAESRAAVRWLTRPVAILTAAAAALALLFGGVAIGRLLASPTAEQQHAAQFAALNAAPDVQRMGVEVEGAGTVTLVVSQTLERSALVWEEMPELPEDRVYELWYLTDEPIPAGLIDPESGPNFRVLDGPLPEDARVGLTVEPDGGSEAPTTDPVLVLETSGA